MSSCLALRIASNDHFSFFSTAAIHTARLRSHGKGRMRVFRKVGVEIFKCHANRSDIDFKVLSCTAKNCNQREKNIQSRRKKQKSVFDYVKQTAAFSKDFSMKI